MRISDWSSDVCSSNLRLPFGGSVRVEAMAAILAPVGPVAWHQRDAQAIVRPQFGRRLAHRAAHAGEAQLRSEEHTSELQLLMRISYAVFCLEKIINT